MTEVVTDAREITAKWLERALRRAGVLQQGRVAAVDVDARSETWSSAASIRPRYSDDATGAPERLFLKMCPFAEFGPSEVDYYRRDYVGCADAPLVRCYDAQYDAERLAYHVLLDDVSATHTNLWQAPVTPALVDAIADGTAALHACRWRAAAIEAVGERLPGNAEIDRYFAHIARGLEPLLAVGGNDVRDEWRPLLREIFAQHPRLMRARTREPRGICLVHGDINPGNLLAPRPSVGAGLASVGAGLPAIVYLIDRQPFDWSLRVWLGVSDLAYLMCSFWTEADRRAFERRMLERYHAGLVARGIADYSYDQMVADYRLAVVQSVYVAVEWCVLEKDREEKRWLWSRELRCAMSAFEELHCRALWAQP